MAKPKIQALEGDITQIPADALMTAIYSGGLWFGGIDRAIKRVAGDQFHAEALFAMPLKNLQTIVARGKDNYDGKRGFKDVIFIVDDLESSLDKVVYAGLETAHTRGYNSLLIPTIRLGIMADGEETKEEAIRKIADGLNDFVSKYAEQTKLEDIKIVVYNDLPLLKDISSALRGI